MKPMTSYIQAQKYTDDKTKSKKPLADDKVSDMKILSLFDAGEWSGGVPETVIKRTGTQSIKLTSTNLAYANLNKTALNLNGRGKNFWLSCYIENVANLYEIEFRFCVAGDYNKRFIQSFSCDQDSGQYLQNGWNEFVGCVDNMEMYGVTEADLGRIERIRVAVRARAGVTAVAYIDMLGWFDNPMKEGVVSITFDDAYKSLVSQALPYMSKYNYRGVAYVPTALVGSSSQYCTVDDIKLLHSAGWDISSHTHNHVNLTTIPLADVDKEIELSLNWLEQNGLYRGYEHFSYPQGANNPEIRSKIEKWFTTARISTGNGAFPKLRLNSFPMINRHQVQVIGVYSSTALSDVYAAIDLAMKYKLWCILMFHGLLPGEGVTMDVQMFKSIMDYLNQKQTKVLTFSEITSNTPVWKRVERKANKLGYEDVEIADSTKGYILKDRTSGKRYRLFMNNGVISSEEVL